VKFLRVESISQYYRHLLVNSILTVYITLLKSCCTGQLYKQAQAFKNISKEADTHAR